MIKYILFELSIYLCIFIIISLSKQSNITFMICVCIMLYFNICFISLANWIIIFKILQ